MGILNRKEEYTESSRQIEQGKVLAALSENAEIQNKMAMVVMEKIQKEIADYIEGMLNFKIQGFLTRLEACENELLKDTASGKRPVEPQYGEPAPRGPGRPKQSEQLATIRRDFEAPRPPVRRGPIIPAPFRPAPESIPAENEEYNPQEEVYVEPEEPLPEYEEEPEGPMDRQRVALLSKEKERIDRELMKLKQAEGKMRRDNFG